MRSPIFGNLLVLLGITILSLQIASGAEKNSTQTAYEQMVRKALKTNNPRAYFDKYVKGNYYLSNEKPVAIRHVNARLFQFIGDSAALFETQEKRTVYYNNGGRQEMVWAVTMMVEGIQSNTMSLDGVYDLTVKPVGIYDYTTLRGNTRMVTRYKPIVDTINFETYKRLMDSGVAFPGE